MVMPCSIVVVQNQPRSCIHPSVANACALQRRGGKGEAVAFYCEPLATKAMQRSGVPVRVKKCKDLTYSLNEPMVTS